MVVVGRQAGNDEVDALRVHDAMVAAHAPFLVQLVDERAGGVDDRRGSDRELAAEVDVAERRHPASVDAFRRDEFDVVGGSRTGFDGGTDEREDEPSIVVDEDAVEVLDAPGHARGVDGRLLALDLVRRQQPGWLGAELSDDPVAERTDPGEPGLVRRRLVECCVEPDLTNVGRIRLHQSIARPAQLEHEPQLVVLQVLEAAPHQVRRRLAGETGEVTPVDQCDRRASSGQGCGGHRTIDAAADDQCVEMLVAKALEVTITQAHRRSRRHDHDGGDHAERTDGNRSGV